MLFCLHIAVACRAQFSQAPEGQPVAPRRAPAGPSGTLVWMNLQMSDGLLGLHFCRIVIKRSQTVKKRSDAQSFQRLRVEQISA